MFPYFTVFRCPINVYAIIVCAGAITSGIVACRFSKRYCGDCNDNMLVIMLLSCIGVFFGAHIVFAITNIGKIIEIIGNYSLYTSVLEFLFAILQQVSGMVFYGGLLGGCLVGYFVIKRRKLCVSDYLDACAPVIPLFHTFGRIGCFFGGCCYGIKSNVGFKYNIILNPSESGYVRFPVQLTEAVLNFVLFLILWSFLKKRKGLLKKFL